MEEDEPRTLIQHEYWIARYLRSQAEFHARRVQGSPYYETMVHAHYTRPGSDHPDDVYYPLNKWEEVKAQDGIEPPTRGPIP